MAKDILSKKEISKNRLNSEEMHQIDAYWRAALYLCVGMIYLKDNPLLREPLEFEHLKQRLLGHWGSDPGQCFTWVHLNRMIKKYDLNMIFISGPGHGWQRYRAFMLLPPAWAVGIFPWHCIAACWNWCGRQCRNPLPLSICNRSACRQRRCGGVPYECARDPC